MVTVGVQVPLTFGVGIPCPEPGYYVGVPMEVYHAWDAASNGQLQIIKRSPAHLKAVRVHGSNETEALRFGAAAHMAILEPELFSVRYAPKAQCSALTAKGKGPRCESNGKFLLLSGDMVCGTHRADQPLDTTKELMDPADYAAVWEMRGSLSRKRRAANLVGAAGDFEVSIVWDEVIEIRLPGGELVEVTVRVKGRIDHYSPDLERGTALDVKTTEDAEEQAFTRSIYRYGYHCQGGLYMRGLHALNLPAAHYTILAAEKTPPYEVGVFRMTEGALDAGEQTAMKLLKLYALCKHTGEWPGYQDRVRDVTLPDWAWKATDDELQRLEETWGL